MSCQQPHQCCPRPGLAGSLQAEVGNAEGSAAFIAQRSLVGLSNTSAIWPHSVPQQLFPFPLSALEPSEEIIKQRVRCRANNDFPT